MYAVIDAETTGLDPWRNEILTFTTIITDENLKEKDRFSGRIRPRYEKQWSREAERVHGITISEARGYESSEVVINKFIRFMDAYIPDDGYIHGAGFAFICHALPFKSYLDLFDRNFIFAWFWNAEKRHEYYRLFPENKVRSTILKKPTEAKRRYGIANQKLSTWIDILGINKDRHHESEFDAEVCLKILKYQLETDKGMINER